MSSDDVKITEPTDDRLRDIARKATGTGYYSGGVNALRAVWNAARAAEIGLGSFERDALAAVIEEARMWNRQSGSVRLLHLEKVLSQAPSDALVERDARIRAEVIDWFQNFDRWLAAHDREVRAEVIDWIAGRIRSIPHWWDADTKYGEFDLEPLGPRHTSEQGAYMEVSRAVDDARVHFGLTEGADRG